MDAKERQRNRYRNERNKIFDMIGRDCAMRSWQCKGSLTVDHIQGRDYALENMGGKLNKIYLEEARKGLLRPLCAFHNSSLGGKKSKRFRNYNHHIENRKCFCRDCKKFSSRPGVF